MHTQDTVDQGGRAALGCFFVEESVSVRSEKHGQWSSGLGILDVCWFQADTYDDIIAPAASWVTKIGQHGSSTFRNLLAEFVS